MPRRHLPLNRPARRVGRGWTDPAPGPVPPYGAVHRPPVRLPAVTDDVLSTDQVSSLKARVADLMPGLRADLEALTRIPSVSLDAFDQAHVEASAEATAELLRAEGLEVEIVREGGRP